MDIADIAIHLAIAEAVIFAVFIAMRNSMFLLPSLFWLAVVNIVAWPLREAMQHWPDLLEIVTHPQSLMEWLVPVVAGTVTVAMMVDQNRIPPID